MKKNRKSITLMLRADTIRLLSTKETSLVAGGITSHVTCDSQQQTDCFTRCGGGTC